MYRKIDTELLYKIRTQNNDNKVDAIIVSSDYQRLISALDETCDIKKFSFINGVAINCSIGKLLYLSNLNCVKYISSSCRVSSLIYKSKKFINLDSLEDKIERTSNHSVVIMDTGVYPHIDFCLGRNRIIKFVDLLNDKDVAYDDNGHGTFVCGVLAGLGIADKYSGIDKFVNVIVIKALDKDGETSTIKILEAMQWVVDNKEKFNIKVVCMSFGSILAENDPLMYGAETLWNNGICVVSAAGNSGPEKNTIMSPGANKKIITVGALDNVNEQLRTADFSSRGPVFNYYKPDILMPGVDIVSTNVFSQDGKFYTTMSGTSVATPMVAGVASLLYSINPNYTPNQIKYMLINSCVKITGDRNSEGYGYLDLKKIILI